MTLADYPTADLYEELARRLKDGANGLENIVQRVADEFGFMVEDLYGFSKDSNVSAARYAAWLVLEHNGYDYKATAKAFNRTSPTTIAKGKKRGRQMIQADRSFARHIKNLI